MENLTHNLSIWIDQFISELTLDEKSDSTIKNYRLILESFYRFCVKNNKKTLNTALFREYQGYLEKKGMQLSSINNHTSAIRAFGLFLQKNNYAQVVAEEVKLKKYRYKKTIPYISLSLSHIAQLPFKKPNEKEVQLRDALILELLTQYGLSAQDIAFLQKNDVIQCKTLQCMQKKYTISLSDTLQTMFHEYLSIRSDNNPALFIRVDPGKYTTPTTALTPRSIQRLVRKYCTENGIIDYITPKTFKHIIPEKK